MNQTLKNGISGFHIVSEVPMSRKSDREKQRPGEEPWNFIPEVSKGQTLHSAYLIYCR